MYIVHVNHVNDLKEHFDQINEQIFSTQDRWEQQKLCKQRSHILREIEKATQKQLSPILGLAPASSSLVKRSRRKGIIFNTGQLE